MVTFDGHDARFDLKGNGYVLQHRLSLRVMSLSNDDYLLLLDKLEE